MDKTEEFERIICSLQNTCFVASSLKHAEMKKTTEDYEYFSKEAGFVSKYIYLTHIKLDRLSSMSKDKSLFNDRPLEFENLTCAIKDDIVNLINRTNDLKNDVQRADTNERRYNFQSHCSNLLLILQSKLACMSYEFRQILELRKENQMRKVVRRDKFQQNPLSLSFPSFSTPGFKGSVLLTDEYAAMNLKHENQAQLMLIDRSESYLESRKETMKHIESTIVELGTMFQNLAFVVKEQEEIIQRIDSNLDKTELNIESAHGEVLKYSQFIHSNRLLIIKVFGVIIIFTFFVILLG